MDTGRKWRDSEVEWMKFCAILCVALYNCYGSVWIFSSSSSSPPPSAMMDSISSSIMPIIFLCSSEAAMSYVDTCTFSGDKNERGGRSKSSRAVRWFYEEIFVRKTNELLPFFLFSYLVSDKIHSFIVSNANLEDITENIDWSFMPQSSASFFLYLWSMFVVNGFYLGSLGTYGFFVVLLKLVLVVVPWVVVDSGGDAVVSCGGIAAFIVPYAVIFTSAKFFPGNLAVFWVNILTIFACTCLTKYLSTHDSSLRLSGDYSEKSEVSGPMLFYRFSPAGNSDTETAAVKTAATMGGALDWIEMNNFFVCGMLVSSMFGCFGTHPSWVRGAGITSLVLALLFLFASAHEGGGEEEGILKRTALQWLIIAVSRCVVRATFADHRSRTVAGDKEKFVYDSSNYVYAVHAPLAAAFAMAMKASSPPPNGDEGGVVWIVFLLTVFLCLVITASLRAFLSRLCKSIAPTLGRCCGGKGDEEQQDEVGGAVPFPELGRSPPNSVMGTPVAGIKSECRNLMEKSLSKRSKAAKKAHHDGGGDDIPQTNQQGQTLAATDHLTSSCPSPPPPPTPRTATTTTTAPHTRKPLMDPPPPEAISSSSSSSSFSRGGNVGSVQGEERNLAWPSSPTPPKSGTVLLPPPPKNC